MLTIDHVLIGGVIGVVVNQPAVALVAGIASHLIADAIPHLDAPIDAPRDHDGNIIWTPRLFTQGFLDVGLGTAISLYVGVHFWSTPHFWPFVLGAFGGFLPDLVDNVPYWRFVRQWPGFRQFHVFHDALHDWWNARWPMRRYLVLGVLTQVAAVTAAILTLKGSW